MRDRWRTARIIFANALRKRGEIGLCNWGKSNDMIDKCQFFWWTGWVSHCKGHTTDRAALSVPLKHSLSANIPHKCLHFLWVISFTRGLTCICFPNSLQITAAKCCSFDDGDYITRNALKIVSDGSRSCALPNGIKQRQSRTSRKSEVKDVKQCLSHCTHIFQSARAMRQSLLVWAYVYRLCVCIAYVHTLAFVIDAWNRGNSNCKLRLIVLRRMCVHHKMMIVITCKRVRDEMGEKWECLMGKWEEKKNGFYQRFELFAVVVVVVVVVPFGANMFISLMADVNVSSLSVATNVYYIWAHFMLDESGWTQIVRFGEGEEVNFLLFSTSRFRSFGRCKSPFAYIRIAKMAKLWQFCHVIFRVIAWLTPKDKLWTINFKVPWHEQ